jgi:hypothetical protein
MLMKKILKLFKMESESICFKCKGKIDDTGKPIYENVFTLIL